MAENSKIEWTHHTFNPWIGCQKVSPGCAHCYAETLDARWGNSNWGVNAPRRVTSDANWRKPLKWNKDAVTAGETHRVFVASMADVFEDRRDLDEPRTRLFALIEATPNLQWLLLSKRPEKMLELTPEHWRKGWPANTVAMTSVENQEWADKRIPELLKVPAPLRGLSCEPLLGALDLTKVHYYGHYTLDVLKGLYHIGGHSHGTDFAFGMSGLGTIHWVISGAESGHGARPMSLEWVRSLRNQCTAARVAFFFKQDAYNGKKIPLPELDGKQWAEFPRTPA